MARRLGTSIVSLLALAAVAACSDSPVAPEVSPSTDVAFAKGGRRGGTPLAIPVILKFADAKQLVGGFRPARSRFGGNRRREERSAD